MRRKRNRRLRPRTVHTPLRLTSMMDILTTLLLFLLKSFVVEGEAITPVPGVNLPESSSNTPAQASVVVAIFNNTIMLDGEVVAQISRENGSSDLLIEPLADRLDAARERTLEIAKMRGSDDQFHGRVSIQGDREIEFDILQRVMYTCGYSGYEELSLAVLGTS
jgi:biopolymer transport protein ExbD